MYWEPVAEVGASIWAHDVSAICPTSKELFGDITDIFSAVTIAIKSVKVAAKTGIKQSKVSAMLKNCTVIID